MNLVIVESPTKARTLSRFLGSDYRIEATMGHIRDLPKSKLGVDVEHDFTPDYITVKGRADRIKELEQQARKSDQIILATDPDREGEAIAYHVSELLKLDGKSGKLERIVFHEITEAAIKEALTHPRGIDMKLIHAQQARRVLDRLVGYKLSPLLWYKVRQGLSAGRVQSVAVRLIVEREREIEAFKPVEYWVIEAELAKRSSANTFDKLSASSQQPSAFLTKLVEKDGQKIEVNRKDQADQIVADLEKASYNVANIEKKETRRHPYPPFTTSTLQQAAVNRYGWSAKKTMQIAQGLYEEGFITYHRTDSTNIAQVAINEVREYIKNAFGSQYLPASPRIYKTKSRVAQEAHEAIRPTVVSNPFDSAQDKQSSVVSQVGRDAERLYSLIWKRFVASQMTEAVYDQTNVDVKANVYKLRAAGSIIKFAGWFKVYADQKGKRREEIGEDGGDKENRLPELTIGELLNLIELTSQQKFTEPPPRYNEASLIKSLEEKGIGRPSTYAPTISTIVERYYVEKIDRRLQPTPLGVAVNDFLVANFPNIVDYDFTAKMEGELDDIANGEAEWVPTIRDFYEPFNAHLASVYKEAKRVKVETESLDESCPTCGQPLVVRIGRFGKFVACSTYPNCKFTKAYIEKIGLPCPKCGGEIIVRNTKRGKRFYGCSNYPKCDFASWTKPKAQS